MNGYRLSPYHTQNIFSPDRFAVLVDRLSVRIGELQAELKFNALAGCGNSGLLLLGALGYRLGLPFWAVRKGEDTPRDKMLANGWLQSGGSRYLIIDDLISSGETIQRIYANINQAREMYAKLWPGNKIPVVKPVAVLTYESDYGFREAILNPGNYSYETGKLENRVHVPCFFLGRPRDEY